MLLVEVFPMAKSALAIKIETDLLKKFKAFCTAHGIKFSFFVEEAIKSKLEEEELKEDLLDFKTLRNEENQAIPLETYLRERRVSD